MTPGLEAAELPADAIEVGRILDAWGVRGWFKILPYSADPEALFSSKRWYLMPAERGEKTFHGVILLPIQEAKHHSSFVVASARDISDRTHAEFLRGARIFVSRASFPSTAKDEYYWVDLIGMKVVNREGLALGHVQELLSTGPQTVLVIEEKTDHKISQRMIPFVSAFVDTVDQESRVVHVDWQLDY